LKPRGVAYSRTSLDQRVAVDQAVFIGVRDVHHRLVGQQVVLTRELELALVALERDRKVTGGEMLQKPLSDVDLLLRLLVVGLQPPRCRIDSLLYGLESLRMSSVSIVSMSRIGSIE